VASSGYPRASATLLRLSPGTAELYSLACIGAVKPYKTSKGFRITLIAIASVVLAFGGLTWYFVSLAAMQKRDKAAVGEYMSRVQPQLAADTRFQDVRLLGYSCDDVRHPYIPVMGRVASQEDWDALASFIRESKSPVFISVHTVWIGTNEMDLKPAQFK
jgi:hypothetical protein